MSFLQAMNNGAMAKGSRMPPNAATLGTGAPPAMPGLPPPPTNVGAMPLGSPGTTEKTASDDVISALRTLQGFKPSMKDEIDAFIAKIKSSNKPAPPAPATGEPIPPGGPVNASQVMESGSDGNF